LREGAGLTQQQLGDRAGVVGSQINKLELGVNQPTLGTAVALARALGVEVGAFVPEGSTTQGAGEPAARPAPRPRGRPRKGTPGEAAPKTPEQSERTAPTENKPKSKRRRKSRPSSN